MADLHILRAHQLGLARARKIAFKWAEQVEADFAMACTYTEDRKADLVEFSRSGVMGRLVVTKDRFELHVQLGLLVGVFKQRIEAEIVQHLDALLAPKAAPVQRASR